MDGGVTAEYISEGMAECISGCGDCHDTCMETLGYCLVQGGRHATEGRIRALVDCNQICDLTRDTLLRGSSLYAQVVELCAEACARCAEACGELAPEDAMMDRCVEACRRCAETCSALGSGTRAEAH
jgi:hypothetical protein